MNYVMLTQGVAVSGVFAHALVLVLREDATCSVELSRCYPILHIICNLVISSCSEEFFLRFMLHTYLCIRGGKLLLLKSLLIMLLWLLW